MTNARFFEFVMCSCCCSRALRSMQSRAKKKRRTSRGRSPEKKSRTDKKKKSGKETKDKSKGKDKKNRKQGNRKHGSGKKGCVTVVACSFTWLIASFVSLVFVLCDNTLLPDRKKKRSSSSRKSSCSSDSDACSNLFCHGFVCQHVK